MTGSQVLPDDLTQADGILFHTAKGTPRPFPRPLAPLADTHGHLSVLEQHDPAMAIARAALAGVCLVVVPVDPAGDDPDADAFARDFARWQEGAARLLAAFRDQGLEPPDLGPRSRGLTLPDAILTVAGVHPYGAGELDGSARGQLDAYLAQPTCAGVGEIGLDYTCDVDRSTQRRAFVAQLGIACERGLPVELHIRDARDDEAHAAHADALAVLEEVGMPERGCDLHCFTNDVEVMRPFVELGCHVAFGGAATFRRSDDIRGAAAACPARAIISETDCPYMAPVPLRGQECEPAMVAFSAACVADVREEAGVASRQETYDALWDNACGLFLPTA